METIHCLWLTLPEVMEVSSAFCFVKKINKELVSLEILNDQNKVSWMILALVILLAKTQMQTTVAERNVIEDANTNNTDTQIQMGTTQI